MFALNQVVKMSSWTCRRSYSWVRSVENTRRDVKRAKQNFDYFLVLDFEATCEKGVKLDPQEIIEFPCLLVNGQNLKVEEQFHQYIRPEIHKELTPFCIQLTGIIQDMVANEHNFQTTLSLFDAWLRDHKVLEKQVTFVTCGDWDLKVMFPEQCRVGNMEIPEYMKSWVNIKMSFSEVTGHYPKSLKDMQGILGLQQLGRLHSGIDDCHNIHAILKSLANLGYVYKKTGFIR